MGEENVEDGAR